MTRGALSGATPSGLPKMDTWRSLSGLPREKHTCTHEHHIRTIAYPTRISTWIIGTQGLNIGAVCGKFADSVTGKDGHTFQKPLVC
ncbi:hypothetical protein AAG906_039655 [Vitis piasezkii]